MSYLRELQEAHKARMVRLTGKTPKIERKVVPLETSQAQVEAEPTSEPVAPAWAPIPRNVRRSYLLCHDIVRIVCAAFNVAPREIMSPNRRQPICRIRQIAVYLIKKHTSLSWVKIGKLLGGYDTSTVRHSRCKVRSMLVGNPEFIAVIEGIEREIMELLI